MVSVAKTEAEDDLIGTKHGINGHLEIIGHAERKHGCQVYSVKCSICAKDPELFGDGVFTITKGHLNGGRTPCGCSYATKWSKEQYETKVKRKCDLLGFVFNGFHGEWKKVKTKLNLTCKVDGHTWQNMNINSLFTTDKGCPECRRRAFREGATKSDEASIRDFMISGSFKEGTKFWRSDRRDENGHRQFWKYWCPVCSVDEYVEAGLCDGEFEAYGSNLIRGQNPCRCSVKYIWTQEQREYQIKKLLGAEGNTAEFVGWTGTYDTCRSKFTLKCKEHDNWDVGVSQFISNGTRCPSCANYGYDITAPADVYVLAIEGIVDKFTGFGITGHIKSRLRTHKSKLAKFGLSILASAVFSTTGQNALAIEREIKATYPIERQEVEGFMTESVNFALYQDLSEFVRNRVVIAPSYDGDS